jgi:hypothetical protein
MHYGNTSFPGADLIWGSWAPLRVKLFLWLACRKRVWTADRRLRRRLDTHTSCLLCDQENEMVDHILVSCSWAKEVWWSSCSWAGCVCSMTVTQTLQEWWEQLVLAQPARRRTGTSTLFVLICWHLWKERNSRVFERASATPLVLLGRIEEDVDLWVAAGARELGRLVCE